MAKKEVMNIVDEETLALLAESYPLEVGINKISLPRINFWSQDKFEGKGKSAKLVKEAGIFLLEKQGDEVDANGKKVWTVTQLGTEIDAIILYERKQLRLYDEDTEQYTSSPIYDNDDEILPLWCDKKEVARATPGELKAKYQFVDKEGKTQSKIEDNKVLYIEYEGEAYQMTLRGSSMYSFKKFSKATIPPAVLTNLSSIPRVRGTNSWNMITFTPKRNLTKEEAIDILNKVKDIKFAIAAEKQQYAKAPANQETLKVDDEFNKM